jgi:hypothetical protein
MALLTTDITYQLALTKFEARLLLTLLGNTTVNDTDTSGDLLDDAEEALQAIHGALSKSLSPHGDLSFELA